MILYNSTSEIDYNISSLETITSRTIKFIILLIFQVISICCSFYFLFHLITKPILIRTLQNHSIIALIIMSFFQTISDLPMVLEYLRIGRAPSLTFCLIWNFFALSNYAVSIWTMTWTSLERHFLIFHDYLIATYRGKIFFHYIPLITFLIIPWMYYFILIFFYPCKNTFYQSILFCGWCCYVYNEQIVLFNWLTFGVIPTFSITFLNLLLIIRVLIQKRRVQQRINWRQNRRMIIQLVTISYLYLIFDTPTIIIGLIQLIIPTFGNNIQMLYLYYTVYFLPILIPYVCLSTFREIWNNKCIQNQIVRYNRKTETIHQLCD